MRASPTDYKRWKRGSQRPKTTWKIDKTVREDSKAKKLLTQNIQEIQNTRRRPNLRIIGIQEGKEYQLIGPVNIFNKIVENIPTLKNEMTMSIKEAFRTPNRVDQKRNTSRHIIVKMPSAQSKERILKAVREKGHVTYKDRPIRITPGCSTEIVKARRAWTEHADPKRAQVLAQAATPSKTINHHRWRDKDISNNLNLHNI